AGDLTPRMRRITVRSEPMLGVALRPAPDVELHLVDGAGRRVRRRYTIRAARPETGELDLDVLLHGDWPGSQLGRTAAPGDPVSFQGPRGKLELRPAAWHLLVGDESALPAIAAICDELPVAADTRWVHRGAAAPGTPDHLLPVVESLTLPDGPGHGYLLGETRSMVALRALLEARGLAHETIFVKGYWNIGRPDRIAGRRPTEG